MKLLSITLLFVMTTTLSHADSDSWRLWGKSKDDSEQLPALTHTLYKEECGGCHFAYQPQLLPAASWQRIMSGLDQHFGDNAELGKQETAQLLQFLQSNAADNSPLKLARKVMRRLGGEAPLRITKTRFFLKEHDELPQSVISGKTGLKSLSNCNECHTRADTGSFDENEIKIPGIGRWDD